MRYKDAFLLGGLRVNEHLKIGSPSTRGLLLAKLPEELISQ